MICEYLHFTPLTVWTGNLQDNGYFSAVDNEAHGPVDCNYHGTVTDEGTCDCFRENGYYGLHCEHQKPCRAIRGGERHDGDEQGARHDREEK